MDTYQGPDVLAALDQATHLPDTEDLPPDCDAESGHDSPPNQEEQDSANPQRIGGKGRVEQGGKGGDQVSVILDYQRVAIADTPGGGNCAFTCLGRQWGVAPVAGGEAVCDYVRGHIAAIVDCNSSFNQVAEEDSRCSVDKYPQKMNTYDTWGGGRRYARGGG